MRTQSRQAVGRPTLVAARRARREMQTRVERPKEPGHSGARVLFGTYAENQRRLLSRELKVSFGLKLFFLSVVWRTDECVQNEEREDPSGT